MPAAAGDFASLLRPDGTVLVPPEIAPTVLRALAEYVVTRVRADGGEVSPLCRNLIHALGEAATQPPPTVPTPDSAGTGTIPGTSSTVTVTEAATRLECSPEWVRRLASRGRITARRTGRVWLIDENSLNLFRHNGKETPTCQE